MAQLYRVILPVKDLDQAKAFYGQILGTDGVRVSPERHYFDCEGTILACFDPMMFKERDAFVPNPEHIYLAVDDLRVVYDQCRAAGARVTAEIQDYPWGETSFYFEDPFGNPICIVDRQTTFVG